MTVERRIERSYRVRFDEAGPDGSLRASGYVRFAQDLAWIHSHSAGLGRDWYAERGLIWLVRAIELVMLGNVGYGAEISVSTELVGLRRIFARRRSEFRAPGTQQLAGIAITDWVLLNAAGRPIRPPSEIAAAFGVRPAEFMPLRLEPALAPPNAARQHIAVRRSELDPMGHVNNAAYLDYLDELYLVLASGHAALPAARRYRAEFIAPAEAGTTLLGLGWPADSGWTYRLEDLAGREVLRARLEVEPPKSAGG